MLHKLLYHIMLLTTLQKFTVVSLHHYINKIHKNANMIKNNNLPICKNCIHFIEYKRHPYDNNDGIFAKCRFFGEKNLISGEIKYKYASTCRISNNYCGENGKYYEPSVKE